MDADADDAGNGVFVIIFVSNFFVLAIILFYGQRKNRSLLFLASSAVAHILFSICPLVDFTFSQLTHMNYVAFLVVPSVSVLNQVMVNVSYVLETRKERLNGSRLVAAVMVASPWLYGVLVPMPFIWVARLNGDSALVIVAFLFIGYVFPGIFAVITAAVAVLTLMNGKNVCNQEGTSFPGDVGGLDCNQGQRPVSAHPAEDSSVSSEQHPRVETSSAAVRAPVRFPKAEVIVTALNVIYVVVFVTSYAVAVSSGQDGSKEAIALLGCFVWPTFFPFLCALRVDFRRAHMLCQFGKVVRIVKLNPNSN